MEYQNIKEKQKAIVLSVKLHMENGLNKSAAVRKVQKEFGYMTEVPVWNALRKEKEETNNGV